VGIRHALPPDGEPADPACVAAVERTGSLLESLGHEVELAAPAALDDPLFAQVGLLFAAAAAREVDRWGERLGRTLGEGDLEPNNQMMAEMGRAVSAPQLLASQEFVHDWSRRVASWWADDGFDLLVTPVLSAPPRLLGGSTVSSGEVAFTIPWNVSGQPAMSLPLHWTDDGLPIGVQFVAAAWREDLLFRVAAELEQAAPWAGRRPPVHA
jgi:amidase